MHASVHDSNVATAPESGDRIAPHAAERSSSLYAQLLGPGFCDLPAELRSVHDERARKTFAGRCSVQRGSSLLARILAVFARLPPAADDMPVAVTITSTQEGERWRRAFGTHLMRSVLKQKNRLLQERLGAVTFAFELSSEDGRIHWRFRRARVGFIPLPISWFEGCSATERLVDGRYTFEVCAAMRGVGLIVHYRGWLVEHGG